MDIIPLINVGFYGAKLDLKCVALKPVLGELSTYQVGIVVRVHDATKEPYEKGGSIVLRDEVIRDIVKIHHPEHVKHLVSLFDVKKQMVFEAIADCNLTLKQQALWQIYKLYDCYGKMLVTQPLCFISEWSPTGAGDFSVSDIETD